MNKMYKNKGSLWLIFCVMCLASQNILAQSGSFGNTFVSGGGEMAVHNAQHDFQVGSTGVLPGIVATERTSPLGFLSFVGTASWANASNTAHVDGYVRTYMTGAFTFPIGDNGSYRPVAVSAAGLSAPTDAAYFGVNPATAITSSIKGGNETALPTGAPFSTSALGTGVTAVDNVEYWDINGTTAAKITLTWNATSAVGTLTSNTLANLSIIGWDGSKWVEVPSTFDATSILGGSSTLTAGSITTDATLAPNTYTVYTLGSLTPAKDTDGDGVPDSVDVDDDGDGILDTVEDAACSPSSTTCDTDGDGVINSLDLDSDNDGVNDVKEAGLTDANGDGVADGTIGTNGAVSGAISGISSLSDKDGDGKKDVYDSLNGTNPDGNLDPSKYDSNGKILCTSNCDPDGDGILTPADGLPNNYGDANSTVKLQLKVFLQGAFFSPSGATDVLMRDNLRTLSVFPTTEPFTAMASTRFTKVADIGGQQTNSTVLAVSGNDAIVDWVFVELRDASNPATVVKTRAALVQRDGDIVESSDGITPVTFEGGIGTSYYVAVKHRNHLGAMTANAIQMAATGTIVDFTSMTATQTWDKGLVLSDNSLGSYDGSEQVQLGNGKMGLWAGNARNSDAKVKYSGSLPDGPAVLSQVITYSGNSSGLYNYDFVTPVYLSGDVNLDGKVKYAGTSSDTAFILFNIVNKYPVNITAKLYNFDFMVEQIP